MSLFSAFSLALVLASPGLLAGWLVGWLAVPARADESTSQPTNPLTPPPTSKELTQRLSSLPRTWSDERPARQAPSRFEVVDCQGLDYHRQITLMTLQGLVNRAGARLFLVGMSGFNRPADEGWVARFREKYGAEAETLTFEQVLARHVGELRGVVVYDPDLPATQNVAATLGGVASLLPVHPDLLPLTEQAGVAEVARLRGEAVDLRGLWHDHLETSRWAASYLLPLCNPADVGFICARDGAQYLCRDYLAMRGCFVADLSSSPQQKDEFALKEEVYARIRPGSVAWGWCCRDGEYELVEQASRHGVKVLCSTNSPNLSFFTHLPGPPRFQQKAPAQPTPPIPLEDKVYLTFVLSDGDSIPILLTHQWYRWDDPARGQVPFGWEMQPLFLEIAPAVLEPYYETMTDQDELTCGPSGAGYIHPGSFPQIEAFAAETARLNRLCDYRVTGICANYDEKAAAALSRGDPDSLGFLYGWGAAPTQPVRRVAGKYHVFYWLCLAEEKKEGYYRKLADEVRRLAEREGTPCFIVAHLSCYTAGPSDALALMRELGQPERYQAVKPSEFLRLLAQRHDTLVRASLPDTAYLVAGLRSQVKVRFTSYRSEPTEVQVELGPLPTGVSVLEAQPAVTLPPEASGELPLLFLKAEERHSVRSLQADTLPLTLRYAGREECRSVPLVVLEAPEGLAGQSVTLQSVWPARQLAHHLGSEVADPEALGGVAWKGQADDPKVPTHLVWGPYETLAPGRYLAFFRLRGDRRPDQPVADLDVYNYALDQQGGPGQRAHRTLQGSDLAEGGQYRDYVLPFEHAGEGQLEYRVLFHGGTDLTVDRIAVFRVD